MKRLGNESGQTLVMVALSMAVLLGFAAFATDVGVMLHEKRQAQSATDSAAIAAAISASQGNNVTNATYAGKTAAQSNGFTDGATDSNGNTTTTVAISWPPVDGNFTGQAGYVEAVITQVTPTFFMHVFGQSAMTIKTRAVATYLGNASGCIYVLNPNNEPLAANPWGNSTITANQCGILINGNTKLGASDSVVADYVGASGTITGP